MERNGPSSRSGGWTLVNNLKTKQSSTDRQLSFESPRPLAFGSRAPCFSPSEVAEESAARLQSAMLSGTEMVLPALVARWRSEECADSRVQTVPQATQTSRLPILPKGASMLQGQGLQEQATKPQEAKAPLWHPMCRYVHEDPSIRDLERPLPKKKNLALSQRSGELQKPDTPPIELIQMSATSGARAEGEKDISELNSFESPTAIPTCRAPLEIQYYNAAALFVGAMQQSVYHAWNELQRWQATSLEQVAFKIAEKAQTWHGLEKMPADWQTSSGPNSVLLFPCSQE